jgi:hypothetical protein
MREDTTGEAKGRIVQIPPNISSSEVITVERTPSLYINGKPWYITFVGVDRKTGEIVHPPQEHPDPEGAQERTDRFAAALGLERGEP